MITGAIKSQVDKVWDAFWSGGISNPLEVIEQITYLLFLRRLDDLQVLEENKATRLKNPWSTESSRRGRTSWAVPTRTCAGPGFDTLPLTRCSPSSTDTSSRSSGHSVAMVRRTRIT